MVSPYSGIPGDKWADKTKELIEEHPLKPNVIREVALKSWQLLWQTKIGEEDTYLSLAEIDPPAIMVGYFFEKLFAKELQKRYPEEWRGTQCKDEKDIVYLKDTRYSIEIKTSGQLGTKIFGNRSYGQKAKDENNEELAKKEKSGYYITANFYQQSLTLLRFGWIDHEDWNAQKSATGQASGLDQKVYEHKLFTITGEYILDSPVNLLCKVGDVIANEMNKEGIKIIQELSDYQGNNQTVKKAKAQEKYHNILKLNSGIEKFALGKNIINSVWWWLT